MILNVQAISNEQASLLVKLCEPFGTNNQHTHDDDSPSKGFIYCTVPESDNTRNNEGDLVFIVIVNVKWSKTSEYWESKLHYFEVCIDFLSSLKNKSSTVVQFGNLSCKMCMIQFIICIPFNGLFIKISRTLQKSSVLVQKIKQWVLDVLAGTRYLIFWTRTLDFCKVLLILMNKPLNGIQIINWIMHILQWSREMEHDKGFDMYHHAWV